jgi:glycosyltransferase involved in cell wall biosynthesis
MVNETTFSIIIPHKNIPELLQRCLTSIPRREDVQIIVVDDNSDNDKVDFEKFPGLGDPFVEIVFTKESKGAGYARNVGLSKARGKWLLFADADDYFTEDFLQYIDRYKESSYDLIYFGINGVNAKTKRENDRGRKYNKLMREAIENQKYDLYRYNAYVPWGKITKRSLITENNIKFDETKVSNDMMFSLKTAYYAKEVFFDEHKIYTTETRKGSLTITRTIDANFDRFCVYLRTNIFLESIAQKKYKVNITLLLLRLINIRNMAYFYKGMELLKENKINLFFEIFGFCLSLPYRVVRKIKNKILDRIGALSIA